MKVFTKRIEYNTFDDIFKLKCIQDCHIGSPLFDKKELINYLSDTDENTHIIINGDMFDLILANDPRFKAGVSDMNPNVEAPIDEIINIGYKILEPYKDRIILAGLGNHEDTIVKRCGTNPMKRLAEKLGCEYAGMKWMLKLIFSKPDKSNSRTVVVYGHHGYGGGTRTEGGNITKFSKDMTYDEADIYLFGHVHDKTFKSIPRGYHGGTRYLSKDRLLVIAGCFKKNLTNDENVTWEESKGFPIRAIGGLTIKIRPTRNWVNLGVADEV